MKYDYVTVSQRVKASEFIRGAACAVAPGLFDKIESALPSPELVAATVEVEEGGSLTVYGVFRIPEQRRAGTK